MLASVIQSRFIVAAAPPNVCTFLNVTVYALKTKEGLRRFVPPGKKDVSYNDSYRICIIQNQ